MDNSDVLPRQIERSVTAFVTQRFRDEVPPGYQLKISVELVQAPTVVITADFNQETVILAMNTKQFFSKERLESYGSRTLITKVINSLKWELDTEMSLREFIERYSMADLARIPQFGKSCRGVVATALKEAGLALKEN